MLFRSRIVKAGFIIGGQGGDGALRVGGKTVGYYDIAAGSFGLHVQHGANRQPVTLQSGS